MPTDSKILVVEDDPNWVKIFDLLIKQGTLDLFEYKYVTTLADAIKAIESPDDTFDLLILDLMLPDSHANNTLEKISKYAEKIPTIVISTLDDKKLIANAFKHNIQDYLVKDEYDVNTFIHVCRTAIQRFIGKWNTDQVANIEPTIKQILKNLQSFSEKLTRLEEIYAKFSKIDKNK